VSKFPSKMKSPGSIIMYAIRLKRMDWYQIGAHMFRGAFSEVKVCKHKTTKQKRAIKIVDKTRCNPSEIEQEKSILQKIAHRNVRIYILSMLIPVQIIKVYDIYETSDRLYFVMELYVFSFLNLMLKGSRRRTAYLCRRM
jgi:serine/threonine protein kinase